MPRVFHSRTFVRRVAPGVPLELQIEIGQVQTGHWWVWIDTELVSDGTETAKTIALGNSEALYGKLIQVEVRCDDTNPGHDRLAARVEMPLLAPEFRWMTNNRGKESPNGFMTSVADIFILPVAP